MSVVSKSSVRESRPTEGLERRVERISSRLDVD